MAHRGNGKPHVHARDHEHGGADVTRIHYEDVGDSGAGGGIQFDTYPQSGQWIYLETDGTDTSPSGFGVEVFDDSGNGIDVGASSGGQILLQTTGGGDIVIQSTGTLKLVRASTGHIMLQGLPTSDPSVPGAIWRDSSGYLRFSP